MDKHFNIWGDDPIQTKEQAMVVKEAIYNTNSSDNDAWGGVYTRHAWRARRLLEAQKVLNELDAPDNPD